MWGLKAEKGYGLGNRAASLSFRMCGKDGSKEKKFSSCSRGGMREGCGELR
jgi:hypothetical protein